MNARDFDIWHTALVQGAAMLEIPLPEATAARLCQHLTLVLAHNPRAGLTALTDPAEIAIKHYLDSLTCLLVRDVLPGERLVDIGPGGGFPGMVLALLRPQVRTTLIEASARRAVFLRLAAAELGLPQVEVVQARAEEVGRSADHRARHDVAVGRAVAPLPVFLEYALPLLAVGGQVVAMKGPEGGEELAASRRALPLLGGRLNRSKELTLPRTMGQRMLLVIDKVAATPARYPRRPGIPAKRPL